LGVAFPDDRSADLLFKAAAARRTVSAKFEHSFRLAQRKPK
jgi:hypothetical protein